jgi:hypothetical protein
MQEFGVARKTTRMDARTRRYEEKHTIHDRRPPAISSIGYAKVLGVEKKTTLRLGTPKLMTIVHLWYLVLDSVKPRMQEIGGARKAKRMIIDGIWYLSLFDRFGQVKDARTRHCICIGTIGVRARSQKGFPCTAATTRVLAERRY